MSVVVPGLTVGELSPGELLWGRTLAGRTQTPPRGSWHKSCHWLPGSALGCMGEHWQWSWLEGMGGSLTLQATLPSPCGYKGKILTEWKLRGFEATRSIRRARDAGEVGEHTSLVSAYGIRTGPYNFKRLMKSFAGSNEATFVGRCESLLGGGAGDFRHQSLNSLSTL